jgi:CRP/FNR family transcriptional regulator
MEQHCEWKHFRAGEELTRTGQYFRSTMLIAEGLVKVYREDDQGNEFFLYYLQPGDACALSMMCAMKAEASQVKAVAVKDSEILSVPIQQTDAWMSRFKSWNQFVVETFRSRFEELLLTVDHIFRLWMKGWSFA